MRILSHRLVNVYQHKSRQVVLTGSVIGIVGPIGSGKSNLVRSMGSNIHNEWDAKKSRITTLGEKSSLVETVINIRPGLDITIRRDFKKMATLTYSDGRTSIEGSDAVTVALFSELGVDKSILREVVFVDQDSINSLLFALDSTKDRLAAKFFGIDRSVAIEKNLSNRINAITMTTLPESVAEIQDRIRQSQDRQKDWEHQMEEVGQPDLEELKPLQLHLSLYLAAGKINGAWEEYRRRAAEIQTSIDETEASITILTASIASVPIGRLREKYLEEKEKNRKFEARVKLKLDKAKFTEQVENLGPAPYSEAHLAELRAEILRLSGAESVNVSEFEARKAMIEDIQRGAECPSCPLCDEVLTEGAEIRLQSLVDRSQSNQDDKVRVEELKRQEHAELNKWNSWKQKYHTATVRLQDIQDSLDELGPCPEDGNPEKWEKNIASYDNMRETLATENARLQKQKKKAAELTEPVGQPPVYPADFDAEAAQIRITDIRAEIAERARFKEQISICCREVQVLTESLTKAQKAETENLIQTELRAALVRIRSQFHPDGAPKELVGRRIQRMEEKINDYLGLLELENAFTVRACGGFNFEAVFPDKPGAIMATELSGGQKASLSIAFRLAAVETFSSSVGLLVLDEPTASFPPDSIEHFKKVIERLKVIAQQLNMMFIFITHSPALEECFDQLIDLSDE